MRRRSGAAVDHEEGLQPFAAMLAAAVAGAMAYLWRELADLQYAPAVVYLLAASVGAWWCHTRLGSRSSAAFLVAAAVMLGLLIPFGWMALSPPGD